MRTLENRLQRRQDIGNLRQLKDTQHLIDFASNDSLGLTSSQVFNRAVLEEWHNCSKKYGSADSGIFILFAVGTAFDDVFVSAGADKKELF